MNTKQATVVSMEGANSRTTEKVNIFAEIWSLIIKQASYFLSFP